MAKFRVDLHEGDLQSINRRCAWWDMQGFDVLSVSYVSATTKDDLISHEREAVGLIVLITVKNRHGQK